MQLSSSRNRVVGHQTVLFAAAGWLDETRYIGQMQHRQKSLNYNASAQILTKPVGNATIVVYWEQLVGFACRVA